MKVVFVNNKFNNKRLISLLENEFPSARKSVFYRALRKKDIRINNLRTSENSILHTGDEVRLYISDTFLFPSFSVVYEDDYILAIDKPKGIEVLGNNSLTSLLQKDYCFIAPCHRLDRNTEGIILFAKSESILEILLDKFKSHEVIKMYKCKVYGILKKKHDILKSYLFKDSKKSMVYVSDKLEKGYKEIITEYRVLEENVKENFSILEVLLHTGRTHQIRAHLSHIGHPIIGDRKIWELYGQQAVRCIFTGFMCFQNCF